MKRFTLFTAVLLFVCGLLSVEGIKAQGISGYTSIDYYQETDTLDAYSETDLDYDVVGNYDAVVSLVVIDSNGSVIANGSARDYDGNGFISVERFIVGTTPDTTYIARGTHWAVTDLYDFSDEWPYYTYYWDTYYFTFFTNQGIFEPFYYYFASPGWRDFTRQTPAIRLGTTHDSAIAFVSGLADVIFQKATLGDTSADFTNISGEQIAELDATKSGETICGHSQAGFSFTVTFQLPDGTREVLDPPASGAKGFGDTYTADYRVVNAEITTDLSSTLKTGQMNVLAFIRTSGSAQPPYNAIKININGRYNSGQPFPGRGTVRIFCP